MRRRVYVHTYVEVEVHWNLLAWPLLQYEVAFTIFVSRTRPEKGPRIDSAVELRGLNGQIF